MNGVSHYYTCASVLVVIKRSNDYICTTTTGQVPRVEQNALWASTIMLHVGAPEETERAINRRILSKNLLLRVAVVAAWTCYNVISIRGHILRHRWMILVEDWPTQSVRRDKGHLVDVGTVILREQEYNSKLESSCTLIIERRNDSVNDKAVKVIRQWSEASLLVDIKHRDRGSSVANVPVTVNTAWSAIRIWCAIQHHILIADHAVLTVTGTFATLDPRSLCFCLLYTSPSPRDATLSRMPSSA